MKKRARIVGKRLLFVILSLIMVLTALPLTALPAVAVTSGDFEYKVLSEDDKTCEITKYTGSAAELEIPSVLDGYTVVGFGCLAFSRCSSLETVVIPDSVTSIVDGAFSNCTELKSVSIPNSVIFIGQGAFSCCYSLCEINIPNSVKVICTGAFENCSSLTSITIPDSVILIELEAFLHCTSLADIIIESDTTNIAADVFADTAYYNMESNWENGVLYIGEYLIKAKFNIGSTYTVKDGTKMIASSAFAYCALESISIPDGVVNIDTGAFHGCFALANVMFAGSVENIGNSAFYSCPALTNVVFSGSVKDISDYAFSYSTSLTNITLPDGTTNIGAEAFYGCEALENISLPDSVTSIGSNAFGDTAYYNTKSNWDNDVLYIGHHLIQAKNKNLSGSYAIKEDTKTIADSAFFGCKSLTDIFIPNHVESIGSNAFMNCTALTVIYGYFNSYAESYANENGYPFIALDLVKDAGNDISVIFPPENLPAKNTALHVERGLEENNAVSFNIALTVDGKIAQPASTVSVRIPVPAEMNSTECKVYRQEADGTYTNMDAVYQSGYMVFTTTYFSTYILTTKFLDVTVGDVNGDAVINAVDARCILQASSGIRELDDIQKSAADVNGDNKINAVDARWILQASSGAREL